MQRLNNIVVLDHVLFCRKNILKYILYSCCMIESSYFAFSRQGSPCAVDFASPFGSIIYILIRHFNHCHVLDLSHRIPPLDQGWATFSERGAGETFRISSWAGVTNENTEMRMYIYFYCKAGKSMRRLVLLAMKMYVAFKLDNRRMPLRWRSESRERRRDFVYFVLEKRCSHSRRRQTWLRCVEHAQNI